MKVFPSPCQEWGLTVFSNDTTYWVPSLRMPHLSRCQWDMLQCWRSPCCSRPCGVPWSLTSSNSIQWRLVHHFWRLRPDSPGSCGLRGDMKWTLFPLSHDTSRLDGSEAKSVVRFCLPSGEFIYACLSWCCSTCGQGCILLLRFSV